MNFSTVKTAMDLPLALFGIAKKNNGSIIKCFGGAKVNNSVNQSKIPI